MPKEKGWAIAGNCGLYTGWAQTRNQAIADHVSAIWEGAEGFGKISEYAYGRGLDRDQARAWAKSRKAGDRAVRVVLTYKQ